GLKLQERQQLEQAFDAFDEASRLVPQDADFLTAREMVKSRMVFAHVQRGNALLLDNEKPKAAVEFRAALNLDPENDFARSRLEESTRDSVPVPKKLIADPLLGASEVRLQPKELRSTFHFKGDVRGMFSELAAAYGLNAQFDDSVTARQVRLNVDDVDFYT